MLAVIVGSMFISTRALSWSHGSRVHVVVVRGSVTSVESGRITSLDGGMSRVMWDMCNCETIVPVTKLHRTLRAAMHAGAQQDSGGTTFNNSAKSAGKMCLLYLLLSQRGGK
jgi:hypothetical protein